MTVIWATDTKLIIQVSIEVIDQIDELRQPRGPPNFNGSSEASGNTETYSHQSLA